MSINQTYIYSIAAVFFHLSLASATTYWVSPSGNDSTGNGSASNPYATIQKAIDVSASGDLIFIKAGTYTGAGNNNLVITNKSLMFWSESGPNQTIIDAGRAKLITGSLSGDWGFTKQITFHGVTSKNGYMEFGGDWTFDSLVKLDSGTLGFYDCTFRENETKATRLTSHTFLFSTTEGAPTNTELLLRNCLIVSNNIGCGGWVTNAAGGGGGIINAAGQIDRSTLINNSIYTSASLSGLGNRYVINRMRATNLIVWSNNTLAAPYWNAASRTTTYNEPSAVYSTHDVGFSFVDIKGTNTIYASALTNLPLIS